MKVKTFLGLLFTLYFLLNYGKGSVYTRSQLWFSITPALKRVLSWSNDARKLDPYRLYALIHIAGPVAVFTVVFRVFLIIFAFANKQRYL